VSILKINFLKIKKYHFNIFLNKKILNYNHCHNLKKKKKVGEGIDTRGTPHELREKGDKR